MAPRSLTPNLGIPSEYVGSVDGQIVFKQAMEIIDSAVGELQEGGGGAGGGTVSSSDVTVDGTGENNIDPEVTNVQQALELLFAASINQAHANGIAVSTSVPADLDGGTLQATLESIGSGIVNINQALNLIQSNLTALTGRVDALEV